MKFRRILSFMILALMLFAFASCGNGNGESSAGAESSASSEPASEPVSEPVLYTVVYYRKYADYAFQLTDTVKKNLKLDFPTKKYYDGDELTENAIVIGNECMAEQTEQSADIGSRDYGIEFIGSRIFVYGGSEDAVKTCVGYFIGNCLGENGVSVAEGYSYSFKFDYPLKGIQIGGADISEYSIVYAATNDEAKYYDIADILADELDLRAGYIPKVADASRGELGHEIILGICDRTAVGNAKESQFDYNEYRITVTDGDIAVIGNNACAVYHGCMALLDSLKALSGVSGKSVVINDTCDIVKVACVGDSITQGINSTDPYEMVYPVYLQRMLGYDYYVKNLGLSGYSVVRTDPYAYSKSAQFRDSKALAADVVIFMLGTNDGNPGQAYKSWEDGTREVKYRDDVNFYLDTYLEANPDAQIYMCIPAILFETTSWPWEGWTKNILEHVIPLNKEIAEARDLATIDIYTWSLTHSSVFKDGLHPYNESYRDYAQCVYDEIKDTIKKPTDK